MNKSKKGSEFLGEHTLNLIIAVFCIVALVAVGAVLIGFLKDKTYLKQAEGYLGQIEYAIQGLTKVGDSQELLILSPKDWWIGVWPNSDGEYPPACRNRPCVCISKDIQFVSDFPNWNNAKQSVCKTFENKAFSIKTGLWYRLVTCGFKDNKDFYKIAPVPLSISITLKENNEIYFAENC